MKDFPFRLLADLDAVATKPQGVDDSRKGLLARHLVVSRLYVSADRAYILAASQTDDLTGMLRLARGNLFKRGEPLRRMRLQVEGHDDLNDPLHLKLAQGARSRKWKTFNSSERPSSVRLPGVEVRLRKAYENVFLDSIRYFSNDEKVGHRLRIFVKVMQFLRCIELAEF